MVLLAVRVNAPSLEVVVWMITVFMGGLGSGKTLTMSVFAAAELAAGGRVCANYPLVGAERVSTWDELYAFDHGTFCWDEAHVDMDSREFAKNIESSSWILQTRKDGVNLSLTTQHFDQIDKRIRNIADMLVICSKIGNADHRGSRLEVVDLFTMTVKKKAILWHSSALYATYDTKAKVRPLYRSSAPAQRR